MLQKVLHRSPSETANCQEREEDGEVFLRNWKITIWEMGNARNKYYWKWRGQNYEESENSKNNGMCQRIRNMRRIILLTYLFTYLLFTYLLT